MWIRFEGKSSTVSGKLRTKLRLGGCAIVVAASSTGTLAEIRDDHKEWSRDLARDYSQQWAEVTKPTVLLQSPCKLVYLTSAKAVKGHSTKCKACKGVPSPRKVIVESKPARDKNGPVETLFKVPGLPEFSVNGLLSVMQEQFDELMALAQEYDLAIKALTKLNSLETELKKLVAEKEQHSKALAVFLQERK